MLLAGLAPAGAQTLTAHQQRAFDIFKELVEINTAVMTGDTARAAEAMAARLRAAGFADGDVHVLLPAPRKGNLVARLRGTGKRKPILLLAHTDVVEARREDWSVDPFRLTERDGHFYGRGTTDNKFMASAFVANLIRYKQEGYTPERDIIVALETDEEIFDAQAMGIRWLLANHRPLIEAEFALNEGGRVGLRGGKPVWNSVQTSEKVVVTYRLEVTNRGGHSSLPTKDNAIYRLAEGLVRLSKFSFPFKLNETTSAFFARAADLENPQTAADMRAIAAGRPDTDALAITRLSANPIYNAQMRNTCVATQLEGGHAPNAPQTARATVNCRLLPGEPVAEVEATLARVLADEQIKIMRLGGPLPSMPSVLHAEIMQAYRDAHWRVLARRPHHPDHERGRNRQRLPAQCRNPDLWPFRPGRRRGRLPRPRQGRAHPRQGLPRRPRVSLPARQDAVGPGLACRQQAGSRIASPGSAAGTRLQG
jgi:acetylornithine deacetylase/succinyl-diaminopimelate desuccinylase-like protein